MKNDRRKWQFVREIFIFIVIAAAIAILMTVLSIVPPLSVIYNRMAGDNLNFVWSGLVAGVISLVLTVYLRKKKHKK